MERPGHGGDDLRHLVYHHLQHGGLAILLPRFRLLAQTLGLCQQLEARGLGLRLSLRQCNGRLGLTRLADALCFGGTLRLDDARLGATDLLHLSRLASRVGLQLLALGLGTRDARLALPFREGDLGPLVAFRLDHRRPLRALGGDDRGLTIRFRLDHRRLAIRLRRLQDAGNQLLLLAQRLLLLNRDLRLRAHLLDAHLFHHHRLPRLGLGKRPLLARLRALGLHLRRVLRALNLEVTLSRRDLRLGLCLGDLSRLARGRCLNRGIAVGIRLADLRVALRLCATDARIALDFRGAPLPE